MKEDSFDFTQYTSRVEIQSAAQAVKTAVDLEPFSRFWHVACSLFCDLLINLQQRSTALTVNNLSFIAKV